MRCVFFFLWFVCVMLAPAHASGYALLIGVDKYESPDISELKYACADVKAVGKVLVDDLQFPENQVIVMTSDAAKDSSLYPSSLNVLKRLVLLANIIKPDDTFLFYFSGHGFQRPTGQYLATTNTSVFSDSVLKVSSLSMENLNEEFARLPASRRMVILDACRNDPEKGKNVGGNTMTAEFLGSSRTLGAAGSTGVKARVTLLACSQGQRAWEWDEQKHGVFTFYLLEGLKGAAVTPDGNMTAQSLCLYVQDKVREWSRRNKAEKDWQNPDFNQSGDVNFPLRTARFTPQVRLPASPAAPEPVVEIDPVELPTTAVLQVNTDPPGAAVFVDGKLQGVTPGQITVEVGVAPTRVVEIGVELAGYKAGLRKITLTRGKSYRTDWKLARQTPELPPSTALPPQPAKVPQPRTPEENEPVLPPSPASTRGALGVGREAGETKVNPVDRAQVVWVPAGDFRMGSDDYATERPERTVSLKGYWIYRDPVTVGQYQEFCRATGRSMPREPAWGWWDTHPVVNVSWNDARDYCRWAGGQLPTEAQWEKAARGPESLMYPWGNTFDATRAFASIGTAQTYTAPVGNAPSGTSPYGCRDMAGNVWQWCRDWYSLESPFEGKRVEPQGPAKGERKVLRGGSWRTTNSYYLRAASRVAFSPDFDFVDVGFRVVVEP